MEPQAQAVQVEAASKLVLQYYQLETDHDPGTTAETVERDLPRSGITKALIFDVTAQTAGTSAGGRAALTSQLDQISVGVVESNRVSEIDGEDLDAFNVLRGNHALIDVSATNNQRNVFGYTYAFDPFMLGPNMDYSRPFGLPGSVARKIRVLYDADATTDAGLQLDDKRMAISAIVSTDGSSAGYMSFTRHSFTGATGGVNTFTTVPTSGPNSKLLGVMNFEATSAPDITADTEHRTTQTIRSQALTVNRKDILGPIYTTTMAAINGQYETGAINDEGYTLWNLGFRNDNNSLGVPTVGGIPSEMEIKTSTGAATAARVHAVILNTNI